MRYNKPTDESNLFVLDQRLANDSLRLGAFELCDVRLFNDSRYDWLMLVPRVPLAVEWLDLSELEQQQLGRELKHVSQCLKHWQPNAKLNVGALGNVVAQLHVHLLLRSPDDPAWPGPVWGHSPAVAYSAEEAAVQCEFWQRRLGLLVDQD
ncbi:hypothetical protein PSI9734_00090 [Pseudidiomarina piscicola]|uniref:HIT domain-containing protein n=1 Tax=Pseudidiomarina piscicola TaxID=2614830 RepID=A0A6S6WJ26_9GAMM|nr:HIT family protein [Pseudidiomarina piscicola]CAB0149526.1 hypothetical protein PSI9734_00090 [Pseudidiomarina piscicola]VZT38974.1 hypothetical protein PSI9734_00090 [Pseudomonas aeruginosa]